MSLSLQKLRILYIIPVLVLSLLLTACGFTLQGSQNASLASRIPELNLQFAASNELGLVLRRQLENADVEISDSNSAHLLALATEQTLERVISVNRNIRAGEYELTMLSSFQLSHNGEVLLDSGPISLFRVYEADPFNAAAKINEAELIKTEMRQELASRIIRRLQSLEL